MSAMTRTTLTIAFAVVAVLFVLFGIGAMTSTMVNSGWMGTGWMSTMMGNGGTGGISWMGGMSWMWLPALLTFALGVLLGWFIFARKA